MSDRRRLLSRFPDPVDEVSARLVAGGVVALAVLALVTGSTVALGVLAYGFVARVLAGPTFSPLGRVVTGFVRPRLPVEARPVPGPPKRFAQGIGAAVSVSALVAHLAGASGLSTGLLAALVVAAGLEAGFGLCLGCVAFARLVRAGLVPESVCEACADLTTRPLTGRS
jgi:hypothetical protein